MCTLLNCFLIPTGMTGTVSVDQHGDRQMDISMYRYLTNNTLFVEYARYRCLTGNISQFVQVSLFYLNANVLLHYPRL